MNDIKTQIVEGIGGGTLVTPAKYLEAVRKFGFNAKTLAFAAGATPESIEKVMADPEFKLSGGLTPSPDILQQPGLAAEPAYSANATASKLNALVNVLGSLITSEKSEVNDDNNLNEIMRTLHRVNLLSIEQIAALAGVSPDTLYDFAEKPSSVPNDLKYHLAMVLFSLYVALNFTAPHNINIDSFAPTRSSPDGLTPEEMQSALAEMRKPIKKP